MATGSTKAVKVYGVFSNGTSKLVAPANLSYNCAAGTATGLTINSDTGVLTAGSAEGEGTLTVSVAEKPGVSVVATITVTA